MSAQAALAVDLALRDPELRAALLSSAALSLEALEGPVERAGRALQGGLSGARAFLAGLHRWLRCGERVLAVQGRLQPSRKGRLPPSRSRRQSCFSLTPGWHCTAVDSRSLRASRARTRAQVWTV